MPVNGVVQRKLALLDQQVLRMEAHLKEVPVSTFKDDWVLRSMAERALQVAVEIMIDVAERVIAYHKAGPVATAAEAMEALVRLGALKTAQPYVDMVRFRNLIVHQYEAIDPALLYELTRPEKLADFRRFRDEIDALVA